jgi:hypothetical protein
MVMRALVGSCAVAVCLATAGLSASGDPPDLYQRPQLLPSQSLPGKAYVWMRDPWRWVGRRSEYALVKPGEAASNVRRYAGRLLHADGDLWRHSGPFGSYEILGDVAHLSDARCLELDGEPAFTTRLGPRWHPRNELNGDGQRYGWSGSWYGLVDAYANNRTESSGFPLLFTAAIIPDEPFSSAQAVPRHWLDTASAEVAKSNQGNAEAELALATAGGGAAHAERAVELFERDLAKPAWLSAEMKRQYFALGWTHERFTHDYRRAAQCYRIAHQELGDLPGYQGASYLHHAICESRLGHRQAARALLVEYLDRWPFDFNAEEALTLLRNLGFPHDAKRYEFPADHAARTRQALAALKRGEERAALQLFQGLSRDCPVDFWSRLEAGYLSWSLGETSTAHSYLDDLSSRAPAHAAALRLLLHLNLPYRIDAAEYPLRQRAEAVTANSKTPYFDVPSGGYSQPVLAWVNRRLTLFPDDPATLVLRARLGTPASVDNNRFTFSARQDIERAVSLAPASLASAAEEVSFRSWLAYKRASGPDDDAHAQDRQRFIRAMLRCLNRWEVQTWGLHAVVGAVLGPQTPEGAEHRRRYETFRALQRQGGEAP